ncbi:MAG: hypothetical protein ACRD2D_04475 [Terriglobales bacterium]
MRKKRKRYKVVEPQAEGEVIPPRVLAIVLVVEWTLWLAVAGVLIPLLLLGSLFTKLHLGASVWLQLWPASHRLLTATGLDGRQMGHLALWMAAENGLIYAGFGLLLGLAHLGFRRLRRGRA